MNIKWCYDRIIAGKKQDRIPYQAKTPKEIRNAEGGSTINSITGQIQLLYFSLYTVRTNS